MFSSQWKPRSEVNDEEIELNKREGGKSGARKRRQSLRIRDLDLTGVITVLNGSWHKSRNKESPVIPLTNIEGGKREASQNAATSRKMVEAEMDLVAPVDSRFPNGGSSGHPEVQWWISNLCDSTSTVRPIQDNIMDVNEPPEASKAIAEGDIPAMNVKMESDSEKFEQNRPRLITYKLRRMELTPSEKRKTMTQKTLEAEEEHITDPVPPPETVSDLRDIENGAGKNGDNSDPVPH
ncbi:hypothetical protein KIN20_009546 [Parelaphostrongylus tenuis]|uniref:Uncharacterized protein n=1 Tax=Parelaphostrongylus tenuis TaxID=148309 RepID=A0AAD5QNF2_PARTN|nr:hypothetical protein KIN20_009546 [Parelaphostrongylus tenuis]